MTPDFPQAVRETLRRERLVPPGATVVCGLSGGPDSMALVRVLLDLADDLDCRVVAAHLDHALRAESADDAAFCADICREWGVPLLSERLVEGVLGGPGGNVEGRARAARYAFLTRVAREHDGGLVAVGHHAEDRAETFLAQLVRGAGPRGLSLPRYRREDGVIRPLLDRTRAEILEFLAAREIPYRSDPTNDDGSNLRSRLRRDVLPLLARENPEVVRAIGRASVSLGALDAFLEEVAARALEELCEARGPGEISLDGPRGRPYHTVILSSLLRKAVRDVSTGDSVPGFDHLDPCARAWKEGSGLTVDVPGGVRISIDGRRVVVARTGRASVSWQEREVPVPGRVTWSTGESETGRAVVLTVEAVEPPPRDPSAESGPRRAWIDAERVLQPLRVRGRLPGDRYRPAGLGGTVKLQDLFVDRKIPRSQRDSLPLVVDAGGILWVPGFRVDERGRITARTRTALRLEITENLPQERETPG